MTRDEIIRMAREAGLQVAADYDYRGSFEKLTFPEREEFLKLLHFAAFIEQRAAAAEREACAKIVETLWAVPNNGMATEEQAYGERCADVIRARGEKS